LIDRITGAFCTDDGLILGPWITESDFLALPTGRRSTDNGRNDGWSRYWLPRPQIASSIQWACNVFFFNGWLKRLSLSIYESDAVGWDNWSEAQELLTKKRHDDVLFHTLGSAPYRYPWGEVFSTYDPRSGSASIGIHYN
jgi:hypothetical protein